MKALGWWLMLVGTLRLASVWFGFFDIWALRLAVFSSTTRLSILSTKQSPHISRKVFVGGWRQGAVSAAALGLCVFVAKSCCAHPSQKSKILGEIRRMRSSRSKSRKLLSFLLVIWRHLFGFYKARSMHLLLPSKSQGVNPGYIACTLDFQYSFDLSVTEVHGRTFGVWTLLTCTLCYLCAFNLENKPLYLATFLSFIYAFGHFLTEYLIYNTMAISNLTTVSVFAGTSIIWMLLQWNAHQKVHLKHS